jgi:hypothetical protein
LKQIYRFDDIRPPVISEKMLLAEIERRKMERQTAFLAVAGILTEVCLLITALLLLPVNAVLSKICIAYVCIAMSGGGVIAIVFANKKGDLTWPTHL